MLRSPPVVLEKTKSYLRSSRTPVILKANEHGYDSKTVLQYCKTIPTAKQKKNELYFNARCDIAFISVNTLILIL